MSNSEEISGETYIPYEALSEAIIADRDPILFLLSLFPDATEEQKEIFWLFARGELLEGIHLGLNIAGRDPISEIEIYQKGVHEGLNQRDES